jgi:FKBP-type peptidyl-prolyl cis-trans isomerase 2
VLLDEAKLLRYAHGVLFCDIPLEERKSLSRNIGLLFLTFWLFSLSLYSLQPFSFAVGQGNVIKGWDESVIDMSLGEISKIHCTPDYA